jgi:protein-disulfide isomerase
MKFIKTILYLGLITLSLTSYAASTNNNVSPAERAKIEQVVHDYLMSKPEIIIQAVQKLQQKQYDETKQTVKKTQQTAASFSNALFHKQNDLIAGNPKGKVTVVEFFDYQCQHCIDMAPVIQAIITANPDVRVVYKDFPIRGAVSIYAAKAALAANKQGKYKEFSEALLKAKQPLTEEMVIKVAGEQGLNVDQLKKDMDDKVFDDLLTANLQLAKDLKLFGTPAIFIGKTDKTGKIDYVPGKLDQKQLQTLIDKAAG